MPHDTLRPYSLGDWWAFDEATRTRLQRARNALALVQDLVAGQKRTEPPTIEVEQEQLGDLLSLIVEQLDVVDGEALGMPRFIVEHAEEVRRQDRAPAAPWGAARRHSGQEA